MKIIDLTGKRFGKLVVLGMLPKSGKGIPIKWECQCDCGNITSALGGNLRGGRRVSCGLCKLERKRGPDSPLFIDRVGERHGKLTVKKYEGVVTTKSNRRIHQWLCQCDCGQYRIVGSPSLRKVSSCKACTHKLKPHEVKFIREKYQKGDREYGGAGLAKTFGISESYVSRIMKGTRLNGAMYE